MIDTQQCKYCHEWDAYAWKHSCGVHNGVIKCIFYDHWDIAQKRCKFYEQHHLYWYKIALVDTGAGMTYYLSQHEWQYECGAHEFIERNGMMICKYCDTMYIYETPFQHADYNQYAEFATCARWS